MGGNGAVAAYVSAGSPPTATATGILREHERQRDERSAVERPRRQHGKLREIGLVHHDLLRRRVPLDAPRDRGGARAGERGEARQFAAQRAGQSEVDRGPQALLDLA
jgi:hypothetical protein